MPRVSVIIPTYNRADLLRLALDSVLAQTYQDAEIIVADDGSTDDTAAVVESYAGKVRFVTQQNRGHDGATRNLGLRAATGEYVAFLDSDDVWEPTKLEKQVAILESMPQVGLVYTDARCFNGLTGATECFFSDLVPLRQGMAGHHLIMRNFIPTSSVLVRRTALVVAGDFGETSVLRWRCDWEMWLKIAARHEIALVNEPLLGYRQHIFNSTRNEDTLTVHNSCLAVFVGCKAYAPEVYGPVWARAVATQDMHTGSVYMSLRRNHEARRMYAKAIRRDPTLRRAYVLLAGSLLGQRAVAFYAWMNKSRLVH